MPCFKYEFKFRWKKWQFGTQQVRRVMKMCAGGDFDYLKAWFFFSFADWCIFNLKLMYFLSHTALMYFLSHTDVFLFLRLMYPNTDLFLVLFCLNKRCVEKNCLFLGNMHWNLCLSLQALICECAGNGKYETLLKSLWISSNFQIAVDQSRSEGQQWIWQSSSILGWHHEGKLEIVLLLVLAIPRELYGWPH